MRKPETKWKKDTTMEYLALEGYAAMGAVLRYGEDVLVVGCERFGYHAAVYEMVEKPQETGLDDLECRIGLTGAAEEIFKDGGHAMEWCLKKIGRLG
ncbi:MAG: hypothetical protein E7199_00695 [Schwartzia succinivorans]|nr:hypothetical protein [Schwartzia succinivorans]